MNIPFMSAQTVAQLVAQSADAKKTAWEMKAVLPHDYTNPFYDGFVGGPGSGKAVIEIANLNVIGGTDLKIPVYARIGTPGVHGSDTLLGNEANLKHNFYTAKTGICRNAISIQEQAKGQTVIGTQFDMLANQLMYTWLNHLKANDLMYALRKEALTNPNRLLRFPGTAINRETLRSTHVVGWDDFVSTGMAMRTNGAKSMTLGTTKSKAKYRKYMFFGSHLAFEGLRKSSKWSSHMELAAETSNDNNPLFDGNWLDLDGHGIYPWECEDHDADGPIGAPILPRAALGVAITAGTTALTIYGGGNPTSAALTAPLYFQWFSNAQYIACDNTITLADTTTERYLLIQDGTTGLFGFFAYQVTDGNTITVTKRLGSNVYGIRNTTVGHVTWNSGVWANLHTEDLSAGSVIYEANSYGQPFCRLFGLGENALVCGHANIDGKSGIAQRISEEQDYDAKQSIGIKTAWGCAVTRNANNEARNFVMIEAAYNPPGLPTIV